MSSEPNDRPVLLFEVQPSVDDWRVLLTSHPNLLLIGPERATDAALLTLTPHLPQPMCCCRGSAPLTLPTTDEGTLILREVAALEADQQQLLLRWLDQHLMQIVSVTSERLFHWLNAGHFSRRCITVSTWYSSTSWGLCHHTISPVLDKPTANSALRSCAAFGVTIPALGLDRAAAPPDHSPHPALIRATTGGAMAGR